MKNSYKVIIVIALLSTALVLTTKLYVDSFISDKISENKLDSQLFYSDFSYNLFTGNAEITNATLQTASVKTTVEKIEIEGFSLIKYARHKIIHCDAIVITKPISVVTSPSKSKKLQAQLPPIQIDAISIVNGSIALKSDSATVYAICEDFNVKLTGIHNAETTSLAFPLVATTIEAQITKYHSIIDGMHSLQIENAEIADNAIQFTELKMAPLLKKVDFQKSIPYEKDMLFLNIPKGNVNAYSIGYNDDKWQLVFKKVNIEQPNFIAFRDKNKKDDTRYKPLYSKQLRKLKVGISIDTISINKASVVYAEIAEGKSMPGFARINDLHINISNIHNDSTKTGASSITKIKAKSQIMKGAKLDLDWQFDVNSLADNFTVFGQIENIEGEDLNMFLSPSYQANATGEISLLTFDMAGNDKEAQGTIKLNLNDLQLRLNSSKNGFKKIVIEPLINFVLLNKTREGILEKSDIVVVRDKQKSFWNYLWSFISQGSIQTIV